MRWRKTRRGSLLVAALLLFSLLLALGLGLMSGQAARMRVAQAQTEAAQAKALAMAGWADVKAKLGKDVLFPLASDTQQYFSYSEDVYTNAGEYFGNYTVIIDLRWHTFMRDTITNPDPLDPSFESRIYEPMSIYPITCVGKVARGRVGDIEAERVLYFELDMRTWQVVRMEDRGSL